MPQFLTLSRAARLVGTTRDALDNFHYVPVTADGALSQEAVMQDGLARMQQDHPRLGEYDVYIAGPEPLANEAERLLLENRLPRSQLFVNRLPAEGG